MGVGWKTKEKIMIDLQIINSAIIILYFTYRLTDLIRNYITIDIKKTFWEKKPYEISITKWVYHRNNWEAYCGNGNSGKVIFHFRWRNPDKMSDELSKWRD